MQLKNIDTKQSTEKNTNTKIQSTKCIIEKPHVSKLCKYNRNHYHNLSHNNPCFPCDIPIMNFLVLYTCEIGFCDVIDCTVHRFTS